MAPPGGEQAGAAERININRKIVSGIGWAAISIVGTQGLSMVGLLVLARLLEPKAFGLVALTWTFLFFLQNAQETGFWAALVHRRDRIEEAAATVAVATPVFGVIFCSTLLLVSPLVAHLFHTPELTNVLRGMAFILVIGGFAVAPNAIVERELDFRALMKVDLAMSITQVGTAIGLAVAGWGVWALVVSYVAATAVRVAVLWIVVPWRPKLAAPDLRLLRELARYGRFVSASGMLNLLSRNMDNLTVVRVLGAAPLGVYAIGYRLAVLPVDLIGKIVGRPMFAAYSALQGDRDGFRSAWLQNLQRIAFLSLPASVLVAVAAKPMVLALVGSRWSAAIEPMRILAAQGVVRGFASTSGDAWQGLGKPNVRFAVEALHLGTLVPALLLLTPRYGLVGAAIAMLAVEMFTGTVATGVTMRLLDVRIRTVAAALTTPVICSALLGCALVAGIRTLPELNPFLSLVILAALALVAYGVATAVLARNIVQPLLSSLRAARAAA